jgi:hypothetical protein
MPLPLPVSPNTPFRENIFRFSQKKLTKSYKNNASFRKIDAKIFAKAKVDAKMFVKMEYMRKLSRKRKLIQKFSGIRKFS